MSTKTLTERKNLILLLLAMLCLGIPVHAAGSDDALLNMLPEDCMFCLRINNFNESLGKMDQYLLGVSQTPIPLALMANMQLGAIIGDPMLTGIDQGGDWGIFALMPQEGQVEPSIGILVPVNNYSEFVKTNPNCSQTPDGLTLLSPPSSPMSPTPSMGNFLLAPAGKTHALVVHETAKNTMPMLQKALTGDSKLSKRITSAQAKEAVTVPAWAYANLAGLYEQYEDEAEAGIEALEKDMKADIQSAPGEMAGMTQFMEFYVDMLPEILEEFGGAADSATLTLAPSPTLLTLDISFQAKDGSDLAKAFIKNPKAAGSYTMTGYMDDSNAVNGLMKMNIPSMRKFYDIVFEIAEDAAEDPKLKEQIEDFKESFEETYDAMGEEVAFSFSYAGGMPPFKFHEVVEITKPDIMKNYMKNTLGLANDMYKSMGIPAELKYESGVSKHKDATIDTLSFNFTESDDPNMVTMKQEFEKMYGTDGFKYYFAQSPDKFYMVMGPDGLQVLKSLIDRPVSSPASGDIKIAMDALQDTPYNDFVCSINIIKLMKGMGEMMQTMGAQANMGPVATMFGGLKDVQTQSCLVMGGKVADGQAAIRLGVPKQHLTEIVATAMQIRMQAAAMQQQMQNAPAPGMPAPAPQSAPRIQGAPKDPLMNWIGKPAPELKMVDLEGKIHRVSRLKGKKVMLDFWATWCPPCKESIPDLIKIRTDSKESDLVIIGLSNEPTETLNTFVKSAKINYPIVAYGEVPAPYSQVTGIPTLFLIDSKGVIQDVLVGYHPPEEIQSRLNKIN